MGDARSRCSRTSQAHRMRYTKDCFAAAESSADTLIVPRRVLPAMPFGTFIAQRAAPVPTDATGWSATFPARAVHVTAPVVKGCVSLRVTAVLTTKRFPEAGAFGAATAGPKVSASGTNEYS